MSLNKNIQFFIRKILGNASKRSLVKIRHTKKKSEDGVDNKRTIRRI